MFFCNFKIIYNEANAIVRPLGKVFYLSFKAVFQLRVFHTQVHARKTLNPFQYYI